MIAAEQRIGELLLAIPKANGARTDLGTSGHSCPEVKTKTQTISDMGYGEILAYITSGFTMTGWGAGSPTHKRMRWKGKC